MFFKPPIFLFREVDRSETFHKIWSIWMKNKDFILCAIIPNSRISYHSYIMSLCKDYMRREGPVGPVRLEWVLLFGVALLRALFLKIFFKFFLMSSYIYKIGV